MTDPAGGSRFRSLLFVKDHAVRTVRRYPDVVGAGLVALTGFVGLLEAGMNERPWERVLAAGTLGLPLFFALAMFGEARSFGRTRHLQVRGGAAVALVAFAFLWPGWTAVGMLRYIQLSVVAHLLAAFLPFWGRTRQHAFWEYNRTMFQRFLLAALFSGVLYAGLSVAILAVDTLFGIDVPGEMYAWLWGAVAFVFNPLFFLAGMPDDVDVLETETEYPPRLKIFAQYILVPLVTVYLVILTAYLGKIIVTATWPSGWIGYLVSSVASVGLLALLLVHPLRDDAEQAWIRMFAKWFSIALVPSVIMALMAAWQRIAQYGVTERRYFLVVLALWLLGIALYHTARGLQNLKVVPVSLCAVALFTGFGPWGAYGVSERSQVGRLAGLLRDHDMLAGGQIQATTTQLPFEVRREMSGALRYLVEHFGTGTIDDWFDNRLAEIDTIAHGTEPASRYEAQDRAAVILAHVGVTYVNQWAQSGQESFNYWIGSVREAQEIAGFSYAHQLANIPERIVAGSDSIDLTWSEDADLTVLVRRGDSTLMTIPLDGFLQEIEEYQGGQTGGRGIPPEMMRIDAEGGSLRLRWYITSINGVRGDDGIRIQYVNGTLYLGGA